MDKGAHFHRCDFQVHSPRDIHWTGDKFGVNADEVELLSEERKQQIVDERIQFAKEYLEKARNAGLNSIAITDHHDIVFAKIIRSVSEEENKNYIATTNFGKIINVFPGIEITLSNPPSQCLLIFDSDFVDTNLDSVIQFLGIIPSNEYEKNSIETQRISQDIIQDLVNLHKKLNELPYCRGRYIVLPHVGNSGQNTILRHGFQEHYKKMPCVGGYVDKAISNESGYQNKINGGDVNYGNKSIGLISTSDNRYEDGREFGKYATWIKWAEPTAEAIRQACLAKESRISQIDPELPQIFIKSIDVTASKFLSTFNINLNRQYNALIGGRGTGKSTVLEYLRWGLCDQTFMNADFDEMTVIEKRRNILIQKTLTDVNGEVRITMERNGIPHIVKRNSKNHEILLKIGEGEFQQVKEEDVRKLLPIQSYSQKQLSDVGVRTEELKRFIEQPVRNSLDTLKFQLLETSLKLKHSYNQLIRKKEFEQEIENLNLESRSLNEQIENIRKSLKGISDDEHETISKKSKYEIEQTYINNLSNELTVLESKVNEFFVLFENHPEKINNLDEFENKKLIQDLSSEFEVKFKEIKLATDNLKEIFGEESLKRLNLLLVEWKSKKDEYEVSYEVAKSNSQASEEQLEGIQIMENRISQINQEISNRRLQIKGIGNPEIEFKIQQGNWRKYHNEKIKLLNEQALKFTELSKNLIKAEVTKNINLQLFKSQLKSIYEGTRIREERIDSIINQIKQSAEPIEEYLKFIEEFRLLAELNTSEDKTLKIPITPLLSSCGYTEEMKTKLVNKINSDNWLQLSANELEFNPDFYYTTNNQLGDVMPFSDASAGQQATALLTVLLNQSGIPLLIDQPEDDIDNRAIDHIIKNIWDSKKKRQLIFTSHNANLVVNGDAELVICCDYKDTNSQTRGIIKAEGAIDKKIIKDEITLIMEGGEKAFKLRKDKYGF